MIYVIFYSSHKYGASIVFFREMKSVRNYSVLNIHSPNIKPRSAYFQNSITQNWKNKDRQQ